MRLKPYLQLVRLPNLFTAVADSLAGWWLVEGSLRSTGRWVPLVLASLATYAGGVVLNDVFDYKVDLDERPTRPLPSGQVRRSTAAWLGVVLVLLGPALAALSGTRHGLAVATVLTACVIAYDAGLKSPKDLAGKRVAVTQVGSSFHYSIGLLADKYGFKLSDVRIVPLQSLSNAAAALKGETVDAALLPVSTARKLMDDGGAKLLGWVGDETPWQLGAVFASPKTLANKALVTKVLAALDRADREYHDVILASVRDGKAPIDDKTKPLLDIIAKYTNLPVEQVVGNCAYIDPDGKLDVKNVDNQIKWLQEQGFADKGYDADTIIAKDYVKAD